MSFSSDEARDLLGRWTAGAAEAQAAGKNVAFHGTTHEFTKFKSGDPKEFMLDRALGPHFAQDPEISKSFVMERVNGRDIGVKPGGHIIPVELPPDSKFLVADQPLYDRAKLPDGSKDPAIPEWSSRYSDQSAIGGMVAEEAFKKDPALLERYLEQARAMPADQAKQVAADLVAGKKAYTEGGTTIEKQPDGTFKEGSKVPAMDLNRFVDNYGGRPYNGADRQRMVELAKQSWQDQGYAGIKYVNTSPMENATATNPTSYIVFNPDDVKPIVGTNHVPETNQYLAAFGDRSVAEAVARAAIAADSHMPLTGLPQKPIQFKDGSYYVPGPNGKLRDIATDYMQKAGLAYNPPTAYQPVNEARATKIAQAFEDMKHNPSDPAVQASYSALAREVHAQWEALKDSGLKVQWIKPGQPDPYAENPRLAAADVSKNNHWWGFPTDAGFGNKGEASSEAAIRDNPLLRPTGETVDGHKMVVNDEFRIVHDMFGHFREGVGFRATGEDNAWRSHAAMFSPAAIPAMTSETRGQNSWVNYGPYAAENKHASAADTHYAPQKIGRLPPWVWKDKS